MLQKYNEISVTPHQFLTQKTPTPTHILGVLRNHHILSKTWVSKPLGSISSFKDVGSVERYNDYYIVRPLLSLNRFEIGKFCAFWQLPIYPDISNQKVQFSRNRIRRQLLPVIKLFFNPKIENTLLQFAEITEAENRCIDQVTQILSFAYYPLLLPSSFVGLAKQPFRFCKAAEREPQVEKFSHALQGAGLFRMPFGVIEKRVMGSIKTKPLAQRLHAEGSKQYLFADPTSLRQMNPKGYWKHWACGAGRGLVANPREGLCLLSSYPYVHRRKWGRHSRGGTQKAKKTRFQSNTLELNNSSHNFSQQKKVENFFIRNFFVYFDTLKTEKRDLYWPLVISFLPPAFQRRIMKLFLINQNWKKIRYSQVEDFLTKRTKL